MKMQNHRAAYPVFVLKWVGVMFMLLVSKDDNKENFYFLKNLE